MRKLKNNELKRISIEEFKSLQKTPITIVLDNVRSAMNVGSVFRIADAFLIEKIYLCGITASPPNKAILKTALGAHDSVMWEYVNDTKDLIESLQNKNYHIVGIEQTENSTSLHTFNTDDKKLVLIFGHEVFGVSQEVLNLCKECIEIPQYGTKHSLNISVSVGIVIWELSRRLKRKK